MEIKTYMHIKNRTGRLMNFKADIRGVQNEVEKKAQRAL